VILQLATEKDSLILDSFAGSGTTGHAVLDMNKESGGNRRFILVEMEENVCRDVTAQRLTRVIQGYEKRNGEKAVKVEGLGGGFRYCRLDNPLFDETGKIGETVRFGDLAAHVFFTETGMPIPKRTNGASPFLGTAKGTGYYLLFNGILGDKTPDGGNVLTGKVLVNLPKHNGPKIIFGEGCRLGEARLRREQIIFKQLPYEIKVS
jgi:site-specific DNA-methyltransferase (adenine-specific)/adenine-specific DNA-methyltransferase